MRDPRKSLDEQAAWWVVRLASDQRTAQDDLAFRHWLEQDRRHAQAYADHAALFEGVGALGDDPVATELLRLEPRPSRPWARRSLLAAGLGAGAAGVVVVAPQIAAGRTYETRPGEQRSLRLADGSTVFLDTDTHIRVHWSERQRCVWLGRGQAFFRVERDRMRPFRVFVGSDEVRALGTAFEVRNIGNTARVTLEEGQVAVFRDGAATLTGRISWRLPPPMERSAKPLAVLSPGQQAALADGAPQVSLVDLRKSSAWRYGRLVLDDAALGDTVADLNRYGGPQIVLVDPELRKLRVSGVFHTGRPEAFVESLTAAFGVKVVRQTPEEIAIAPS